METPKLDPLLKLQQVNLHDKHGVEIRIMSSSKNDTHSLGSEFLQISL